VYANVIAIMRPGKNDPKLQIPTWFKRASAGNDTPPPAAAAMATAARAPKPADGAMAELPEPPEWSAADYDQATAFPTGNDAIHESAA
jgi:hypothetical protein